MWRSGAFVLGALLGSLAGPCAIALTAIIVQKSRVKEAIELPKGGVNIFMLVILGFASARQPLRCKFRYPEIVR